MEPKREVLPNGVRFIYAPMPSLKSATFTAWFGVGSRYEDDRVAGISHFLEHMAFKGGKKYPTPRDVSETLDAIGAENNAATGQEYTNYYVRSSVSTLPEAVDVLADTLLEPVLSPKEINKERGVIIEEINMYEDDPKDLVNLIFEKEVFPNHPLGRDVAGKKESVRTIKRSDFLEFRNKHYLAENIVINISGGISYKNALALVEKYFGKLKKTGYEDKYKKFEVTQSAPKLVVKKKKTEQANLIVGFPGKKHGEPSRYAEGLLSVILSGGMSSRLFREVREKRGLAYAVYASSSHFQDTGEFSTYAGVPLQKVDEAIKVILDELYKFTNGKHKVTDKEMKKAKEFYKGHMALAMESTRWINYFFGNEEIKGGKMRTPEEVFKAVEAVKIDDVLAVAREIFIPSRVNLAVVGPYGDHNRFEKLIN